MGQTNIKHPEIEVLDDLIERFKNAVNVENDKIKEHQEKCFQLQVQLNSYEFMRDEITHQLNAKIK